MEPDSLTVFQPAQHPLTLDTGFSPTGVDSVATASAAPKIPRLIQATPAFMAVTLVFCLVTLFVVGKPPGDPNLTDSLSFQHKVPRAPDAPLWASLLPERSFYLQFQAQATAFLGPDRGHCPRGSIPRTEVHEGGSLLLSSRFWNPTCVWDSVSSQSQGWGFADLGKWNVSVQQHTRPVPKPVQAMILGDNITGHLPFEPNSE